MNLIVDILIWISIVVFWATIAVAGLFFLRVILTWLGVNPFGRIPYHLTQWTEPFVRPMRYHFSGGRLRYDLVPLVIGVLILATGLFIWGILRRFAGILHTFAQASARGLLDGRLLASQMVLLLGTLYVIAIFLRFFLPIFGVGYNNKFLRFLFTITEPLIKPLRKIFVSGMFDFSPLIALFLVQLLTDLIADAISR